uniref:Sialidase n=3 Tax=Trypanosoma rangeli TaxID=5698 RepID=O44049_TRYRA|nr:sialidase precursor [Trypanosoma rangeli]
MSWLAVFVPLFLMACASEPASALAPGSSRVELFKRKNSTVPFEESNGTIRERVVHSFRIPTIVNVDGVMVATADARYETSFDNSFIETAVKYSVDDGATWNTQIAIKNSRASSVSRVMDATVIVKGNKLYILVGSFNKTRNSWTQHRDGSDWEPLLVVGEVTKSAANGKTTATISWGKPVSLKPLFPAEFDGILTKEFIGGVGAAIVGSNGNLVYPVQIADMGGRVFTKIMYSEDDGNTWKFAEGRSKFGCSEPAVLEWEGKLIINNRVDGNRRLVYESSDMGKTWVEALGTLSHVWTNSPTSNQQDCQSSFVAVTIEGKRVMLFTHPLNLKGRWMRDRLHLWMTDNQRIFDVGQISIGDENSGYSSVLYKDDKLYSLHEINTNDVYSLVFVRFIGELQLMKSVVRTWKEEDNHLASICTPVVPATPPSKGGCGAAVPTAGLVGFLSHSANGSVWEDVYRCVDANVANAERVPNGLKFNGVGGGAVWPVARQGQTRRYQFANYRFTLVATVTIDELPKGTSPLLGAGLEGPGDAKLLGLSYDKNRQWRPLYGAAPASPTGSWELHKKYHVVLTMADRQGSVYVDGQPLAGSGNTVVRGATLPDISHFYIGGPRSKGAPTDSRVTVTNIVLYNRRLNSSEIRTLFLSQDMIGTDGGAGTAA